ncbi:MAG: aminotransferase class IV [Planctomycetes bacterium]|nr:aminotransferase class IV [Planctomycetota bacterium]
MDKPKIKLPFGTGVFETIAVVGRRPAFLNLHLDRLERGADWLGIPRARERVELMIRNKLSACPETPAALRAEAPGHGIPGTSVGPRMRDASTGPVGVYYPKTGAARGPADTIKHSLRAPKTTARNDAKLLGAWDALVINEKGEVAESTVANIFVVIDGKLITPGDATFPLPGIARAIVLEEAKKLNIPIELRGFAFDDLANASEVFLTSALIGVLRVDFVLHHDGRRIDLSPSGDIGPRLAAARQGREDEDLKTAPGPTEYVGI